MTRALVLLLLAIAPAAAADAEVPPELRSRIPNGLTSVTVRYPGASDVHLALMVPVGAADQSSSLPGLARAVAHTRANPPGAEPPIDVEVSAEWTVFRLSGPGEHLDRLARRLATVWERGDEAGEAAPLGAPGIFRDALFAGTYPDHPLGHPLATHDDLGDLAVRGLARFYAPQSSYLLVVGDGDIFETARDAMTPFKGWPVSSATPTDDRPAPPPTGGETTVALPPGEPPMLMVGARAPVSVTDPAVRLVALQVLRERTAARWSADGMPESPPGFRWHDGDLWAVGPWSADAPRALDAALDSLRAALGEAAGNPVSDEEALAAAATVEAVRRAPAGVDPAGYLELMVDAARRGSSPSVALELRSLGRVGIEEVRGAVSTMAASPLVTVRGRPR